MTENRPSVLLSGAPIVAAELIGRQRGSLSGLVD